MEVEYIIDGIIDIDQLLNLYESVGWRQYLSLDRKIIEQMILNAHHSVQGSIDGELIGFGRSLSDKVLYVIFQDIIVNPKYQRKKIGTTIIHLLQKQYSNFPRQDLIRLFAEPDAEIFYQSLGFCKCKLNSYSVKCPD